MVYSIESGDPASIFAIDSNGVITVADASSLNTQASYDLVVSITDNNGTGLSVAKTVSVTLVDLVSDPVGVNLTEDQLYRFSGSDFVDNTGDTVTRVEITSVPSNGRLFLHGEIVSNGQVVSMSDIVSSGFTYLPASDMAGSDSLTFRIGDDAGFSATTAILTFTIAAEADSNPIVIGDQLGSLDGRDRRQ